MKAKYYIWRKDYKSLSKLIIDKGNKADKQLLEEYLKIYKRDYKNLYSIIKNNKNFQVDNMFDLLMSFYSEKEYLYFKKIILNTKFLKKDNIEKFKELIQEERHLKDFNNEVFFKLEEYQTIDKLEEYFNNNNLKQSFELINDLPKYHTKECLNLLNKFYLTDTNINNYISRIIQSNKNFHNNEIFEEYIELILITKSLYIIFEKEIIEELKKTNDKLSEYKKMKIEDISNKVFFKLLNRYLNIKKLLKRKN